MARIPLQISSRGLQTGPTVNYSGVANSPVANAVSDFGDTVSQAALRYRQQQEEAENFQAQQDFNQFKIAANAQLPEIQAKTPANGMGYLQNSMSAFDKQRDDLMAKVPERLRPQFQALVETERDQFASQQATVERDQRYGWYRDGLTKAVERGQEQVYNTPDALDAARQEAVRQIDASGLPEAEKEEWREKARQGIAASLATRELEANPAGLMGSLGIAVPQSDASALVQSVIQTESTGRANAVSPKGASGLMQVMPDTGVEIALELGDANFPAKGTTAQKQAYLQNPDVSLRYGTHYLNKMLNRYGGDIDAALIAYNGGPARADAWLKSGRDDSVIPSESSAYYKKVKAGLDVAGKLAPAPLQPYLKVASAFLGAHEGRDNGALAAFIKKAAGINIDPRQTAWCAAYVNAVLGSQGVQGTGRLNARSFLDFGEQVQKPELGDIVVLSRGDPNGWQGHVGFFAGYGPNGQVKVLGGNQSNQVSVANYDSRSILGFRRPPSVKTAADANEQLAKLPGGGPSGGMVVTDLDPRFADLPFLERLKLSGQARQQVQQQRTQAETHRKAAYTAYNESINLGILTGEVTSEEQILSAGLDDGDTAARLTQFRAQQEKNGNVNAALQQYMSGDLANLNPLDNDQRKTANSVYDAMNKSLAAAPEADRMAMTNQFIQQTGIIPDPIQANLRAGIYSKNPQQYASAMDNAARINSQAPVAFDSMAGGETLRRDLESYSYLVNTRGLSSVDAAQRLIERASPEFQTNEKVLGPAADKALKDLEAGDVTGEFASGLGSSIGFGQPGAGASPSTENQLLSEYREVFREQFIRIGGDEDEAKALAIAELKKTWGETSVSGERELMKFPPEKFYPAVDGGFGYLRDDMMETALDFAGLPSKAAERPQGPALQPASGDVPFDQMRPLSNGEHRDNGDGSYSTEVLVTIQDKEGRWVNVPSLWNSPNGYVDLGEDEDAIGEALSAYESKGHSFPRFSSLDEAVKFAETRSSKGGASEVALENSRGDAAMITNVYLQPSQATAADIRAGRAPRYSLFYTTEENGSPVVHQVLGSWAMNPETLSAKTQKERDANLAAAEQFRVDESDRPSGIDRDEAFDLYLGDDAAGIIDRARAANSGTGQPQPATSDYQSGDVWRRRRAAPDLPTIQQPGSTEAIQSDLQDQRRELFNANR